MKRGYSSAHDALPDTRPLCMCIREGRRAVKVDLSIEEAQALAADLRAAVRDHLNDRAKGAPK